MTLWQSAALNKHANFLFSLTMLRQVKTIHPDDELFGELLAAFIAVCLETG